MKETTAELFTLYKLIILYMLNKVDFPLSNAQLADFLLGKQYTTYFKFQQALSELSEAGMIREEKVRNRTIYHLTEDGASAISYFQSDISSAIRDDILNYLTEHKYELKNEISVKADYYRNTNAEYTVRCQVMEKTLPLIDLTVTAPSEEEARQIVENWQKKNQEIYAQIMAKLLG